jgi:hypothetical protein
MHVNYEKHIPAIIRLLHDSWRGIIPTYEKSSVMKLKAMLCMHGKYYFRQDHFTVKQLKTIFNDKYY